MLRSCRTRPGYSLRGKRGQFGQALVYGLFFLVAGLAALFFLFNSGQLVAEKTKLVNTGDAVAHSAGVLQARVLNFDAYTNRAMVANTVAIAQLVSLSSWVQYIDNISQYGYVLQGNKYQAYEQAYETIRSLGPTYQSELNGHDGTLEQLASASDRLIRDGLMQAQHTAFAGLDIALPTLMEEVAASNYRDDGSVRVEPLRSTEGAFTQFVGRRAGADRGRFAEVAKTASRLDRFVPERSWVMDAEPDCKAASPRRDWLDRRGGTELIDFDQWKAIDTLSEKRWVPSNKSDLQCRGLAEIPAGWGSTAAGDSNGGDLDPTKHGNSLLINPAATALAMADSASWQYGGLPSFYDLSEQALSQAEPLLRHGVRLLRDQHQTRTSAGRSEVHATARLNAYEGQPAGGTALVAVSVSEVFFERPPDDVDNAYGRSLSPRRPREVGSLFNPFWQVRLVQEDDLTKAAQAMQGVALP